jgi:Zn-dependent peptidase ImmA (M78 family)
MDLDGPTSPTALVAKILAAEPGLTLPIPIEEIARQLDIQDIREIETNGFVGSLVTDNSRSDGFIVLKAGLMPARRRFTIGHELGHFLMVHHKASAGGFACTDADFARRRHTEMTPQMRQEAEANEFAALLLMPPRMWEREMATFRNPDLDHIREMKNRFGVSRDAAARQFATYHDDAVAIVVVKDGKVLRVYRNISRFPKLRVDRGHAVPQGSIYHRARKVLSTPSEITEARAEQWLESEWGKLMPELSEQVVFQQDGHAQIMLWAETIPEGEVEDADDDRTSKQRLTARMEKYGR